MLAYVLVAIGGAFGSVARFAMSAGIDRRYEGFFPLGTLVVNVLGCFLIGLIVGMSDSEKIRQFLMVGVLGGFTTFSAFSLQTMRLIQDRHYGVAAGYVAASLILCVVGTFLGLALARVARA